ncbi:DeoR/GlpR transcriptional regulator [Limibaculum sp. M0105]|uniref:DeoR/GlpR transcriptional regulator n=1 Tax=Thermohalobaculum xanthum TaxID=2753746 RepID=A0A8J7MA30_9RHOB|nr:DeoR/GlpR family DNA-binding transcription regulator [Thermohalobaculum xanthum]MBK0400239.1 DeoR/GlpR transcriptional regulator [Thermohalobaculum xanthum]
MILSFRQHEIVELARLHGRVVVEELAERFAVSPQTIRRDLGELCDAGTLQRVHGGAVLGSGVANLGYDARRTLASAEKEAIGRLCASAIPENASLFINIGTTTEAVARALAGHRDLMAITNNLNVANIMAANPNIEVIVAGGVLRRSDCGLIGEATTDFIRQFKVDLAIIGASALDEEGWLLDFDYREVRVSRAIIENAREVFLVADASKFARSAPVRITEISAVTAFFTDRPPPAAFTARCAEAGVRIEIAEPSEQAAG